jgi:hypothetical protein
MTAFVILSLNARVILGLFTERFLMKKYRWVILVGILIAIPVGWYLISPLFINETVNEAFPTAEENQVNEPTGEAIATEMVKEATTAGDVEMSEDMPEPMDSMTALFQGEFYNIAHEGMGTATVYQLADGSRILRFENFEVLNGPELHVYLSPGDPIPDTVGVELAGSVDLGMLKGNIGDQNYDIPADLDLSAFDSVVIWCVPFRVPFSAAPLNTP